MTRASHRPGLLRPMGGVAVLAFVLATFGCDETGTPPTPTPTPALEPTAAVPSPAAVPTPPPNREVPLPQVVVAAPTAKPAAHPLAASPALSKARAVLAKAVQDHGRDPDNPWAIGHAMLALGADLELTNGTKAVDHLFATYAETVDVGGDGPGDDPGVAFPRSRGDIRIEPHSDLILKALLEGGVGPERAVTVVGAPHTVLELYRHSLHRTWVTGSGGRYRTSLHSMNDTPWALQALSTWAPEGYGWTAIGGHQMTMDAFAEAGLVELEQASAALMGAKARGVMPSKDGKGILAYTCGGQHLIQGVAHAVARGFGPDDGPARVCAQRDLLRWRIDHELGTLDPILASEQGKGRPVAIVLQDQRLKFVGHALETLSKIDAYGLCEWTEADAHARDRLGVELVRSVEALEGLGVFADLQALRHDKALDPYRANSGGAEQVYLDLLGDSAHAVRGIDLATGKGTIAF